MAKAKNGDKVKVNYVGTFEDGTVFNSSFDKSPLEFVVGSGTVINAFDKAIIGMEEGDKKKLKIPPDKAYGEHNKDLEFVIRRENIPPGIEPEIGTILHMAVGEGKMSNVAITEIEGNRIVVDGNHPLAGKTLVFDITFLEVIENA